ncbi:MAG: polymer-forming cytoskeletal protein [Tannerellaceae bacterium]|jgi:cytoskeletal protein CcmA (bactofilin family)|nr:polymer-forming cytoskeletal protein [Tannerellaceae bacterium]
MGTKYNNDEIPASVLHNALAFGTTVKGDVTTDGDFRLDGRLEGTISCGGKIVIGETAEVEGDIISVNAEIFGKVVGSIKTSEVLVLKPTAIIKGIITTQALVVEPSAKFSGTCNMTLETDDSEISHGNLFSESMPATSSLTEGYAAMGNISDDNDKLFK